mgnify:FL=1
MGIFSRGYKAMEEETKRQEEERSKRNKGLFDFFLKKDKDSAVVRFLTEEPVNFYKHNIKKVVNGKEYFESKVCSGEDCKYCAMDNRPVLNGAYLIIDKRPFEYTDSKGQLHKGNAQIRMFKQGSKVVSQLQRISDRYGLTNRDVEIVRLGTGTSTNYVIDRLDESNITPNEILQLLPENLKEKYDGTKESLYDIVQEQLCLLMDNYNEMAEDNYEDDESNEEMDRRSQTIDLDDDTTTADKPVSNNTNSNSNFKGILDRKSVV